MNRRQVMAGFGGLLVAGRAAAQGPRRLVRVGVLTAASSADAPSPLDALRRGLAELGYVEGHDIALEFRFARGDYDAFPKLAGELVSLPVDIIVADGGAAVSPAMQATKSIPIVIATAGDPVRLGFVSSLARPGGNVTGFSLVSTELNLKRLELLRQVFPSARTFSVLFNPVNATAVDGMREVASVGREMGLTVVSVEAATTQALRSLSLDADRGAPVLVVPDAMFWNNRHTIVERVEAAKRPALYPEREYADAGGLIAYGPNVPNNFRKTAGYIDRILKGAQPGEMPIQQPTRFDFIVNMKAARALGIDLPTGFLARADEVIE
jgi:putative ABC transport system substrate-binding protein